MGLYVGDDGAVLQFDKGWYPVAGISAYYLPNATAKIEFYLPTDWKLAATGTQTELRQTPQGVIAAWVADQPMQLSCIAGPYLITEGEVGGISVSAWTVPGSTTDGREQLERVSAILPVLENALGPYPFDSLTVAELPAGKSGGHGDRELVMLSSAWSGRKGGHLYDEVLAHEIAHQWHAQWISPALGRAGAPWLGEGLATYIQLLYVEQVHGRQVMVDCLAIQQQAYVIRQPSLAGREPTVIQAYAPEASGVTYHKGAWVFHMLRSYLGDERFFPLLRQASERFGGQEITLDGFLSFVEAEVGAEAVAFLQPWLFTTERLDLAPGDATVIRTRDKSQIVVPVTNLGKAPSPRTQVRLDTTSGPVMAEADASGVAQATITGRVWRVTVDPNYLALDSNRANNVAVVGLSPLQVALIWIGIPGMIALSLAVIKMLRAKKGQSAVPDGDGGSSGL